VSTTTSSFSLKKHASTDNVVTALTTDQPANMEALEDLLDGTTNDADLRPILQSGTKIADTTRDHEYTVAVSELAADRTVTLPLLTGNDDFVFEDHTQTMTNKTMTSPVINVGSDARSDIYFRNTSGAFTRLAAGTANYPLVTNGASADPAYEQLAAAGIASNAVTTAKINADAVTAAKIGDDVIDSEHYVDASIDAQHLASSSVTTAKLNADAVTAAKIGDDVIDSEHLVDGSIDSAHIGANQVTLTKLSDGTQGGILYYGASGAPTELAAGTDGYLLKTQGGSANPVWAASSSGPSQAVQSDIEAETNEDTYLPPDLVHFSPGVAKFYVKFDASAGVQGTAYNTTSVADNGTGDYTVTIGTDFSSADWACSATIETGYTRSANIASSGGQAAGTLQVRSTDNNGTLSDGVYMHVAGFGDQ
jgi:hypothetical protein